MAAVTFYAVTNIAILRSISSAGLAQGDMALVAGYYKADDRGGGLFSWEASSAAPEDGGRYLTNNTSASGRWSRILNGETANVKMWGAKGDDATDDTVAIQKAVDACQWGWTTALLFPAGNYKITNTIVFSPALGIRGESVQATAIFMNADRDVFRTTHANLLYQGQTSDWDHFLVFENMAIVCGENSTTNAALVMCRPGEAHTIRNIWTYYGGYGIRCFGGGAPGLKVMHVSTFHPRIAGISIEGVLPNGTLEPSSGIVSLIGISGDHHETNSNAAASLVRIYKCVSTVSIHDFKAEGQWGGGLFQYHWSLNQFPSSVYDPSGSLSIYGGTYNADAAYPQPAVARDFVVLKTDTNSQRTASVVIHPVNLYGVRHLIRDDVTGRTIDPDVQQGTGNHQAAARLPVHYDSSALDVMGLGTRLALGNTAICEFVPPTTGWYRVMTSVMYHLGGRLVISTPFESSELSVDVVPAESNGGAQIDVIRKSKDNGSFYRPHVTKARAGSFWHPAVSGERGFLDIYVERLPDTSWTSNLRRIKLAHTIDHQGLPSLGLVHLVCPTNALTELMPTNAIFYISVTNTLTR